MGDATTKYVAGIIRRVIFLAFPLIFLIWFVLFGSPMCHRALREAVAPAPLPTAPIPTFSLLICDNAYETENRTYENLNPPYIDIEL